jgi:glycosyltransferase involved in cell wall biosynthesis
VIFTFWQNILSPHQSPLLIGLAEQGHEVTVVTKETMTTDRLKLGWKAPELGSARVVVDPDESAIQELIARGSPKAIQIMAGARWSQLGNQAFRHCVRHKRRLGILTEAPDPRGMAGLARWGKYTMERCLYGGNYDFVLAMGEMGVRWFRRCGYPAERVFPFAYVIDVVDHSKEEVLREPLSVLYVGRFVRLKGLDLLLRAFAAVGNGTVQLRLLGDGPEQEALQRLARELGIEESVIWLAKRDAVGVQREMARADVTVLPSHKDGWGAVVNESLMVGTPVICSDACGAADMVQQLWLGSVFRAGDVGELTQALRKWIECGKRTREQRERIRCWSDCISGSVVAEYFVKIMEHVYAGAPRPVAPWRATLDPTQPRTRDQGTPEKA